MNKRGGQQFRNKKGNLRIKKKNNKMNIIVNIYFAFSLHFEAFKIAGNAVIILKGNLVALLCCTEHAPFWPYFIALKNYN